MKRNVNCYVVIDPSGEICVDTLKSSRSACVRHFARGWWANSDWKANWARLRKEGWRCQRAIVSIV